MSPWRSTRKFLLMTMVVALARFGAGCSDRACDDPAPTTLQCCTPDCDSDVLAAPVCSGAGWACPEGSVSFGDCPGPRICQGALPGPPRDGGS